MYDTYTANNQNNPAVDCNTGTFAFIFFICPIMLHFKFKVYIYDMQIWQVGTAFYFNNSEAPVLHRLCVGWISHTISHFERPHSRSSLRMSLKTEGAGGSAQQPVNQHAAYLMIQPGTYWTHKTRRNSRNLMFKPKKSAMYLCDSLCRNVTRSAISRNDLLSCQADVKSDMSECNSG